MEPRTSTPPRSYCLKLADIPLDPAFFGPADYTTLPSSSLPRSSSLGPGRFAARDSISPAPVQTPSLDDPANKADLPKFRIRPMTPKIDLLKKKGGKIVDIFQNFDEFVRGMIEKGEEVDSETDLYLKLLSEYLEEDAETIKKFTKIDIVADTSQLTLQAFGEALPQLLELKLTGSVLSSVRDIGTSFKSLKVLWLPRVGLRDLSGLLALQSLEELYASYNFISDISDTPYVEKLHTLDLEANEISDLRQLSYISASLRFVTLAGNAVAQDPKYMANLLEFGKGLEAIDDVPVSSLKEAGYEISSPKPKGKAVIAEDSELMERFKKLGLAEDLIRESILAADSLLCSEPAEEEILRQSIKAQGFKGDKKGKLKAIVKEKSSETPARPVTASAAGEFGRRKKKKDLDEVAEELEDPRVEGYSELVSTTDTVFAGNPLQAAKHKKHGNFQKMDIYSLIDQFKDASVNLKTQISKKIVGDVPARIPVENVVLLSGTSKGMPIIKGPIRARGTFNIKKIRHVKMS